MEVRIFLFVFVLMTCFVLADVTFFEGAEDDFIMVGDTNFDDSSVYCGNAVCDVGEDCESCVRDCGVCEDSGYSPVQVVEDFLGLGDDEGDVDVVSPEVDSEEDFFIARVVFLLGFFSMILFWGLGK